MKLSMNVTIVLFCILTVGCQEAVVEEGPDMHLINSQLINSYNDIALENAVISQHTLYPYHFVNNGAELNELGKRDLAVLTRHFIKQPGHLNIRRHNIPVGLYETRVESVHKRLQEAGIDMGRISISDGMPGGSGVPSESILIILTEDDQLIPVEK
jgi:hypothetical protein